MIFNRQNGQLTILNHAQTTYMHTTVVSNTDSRVKEGCRWGLHYVHTNITQADSIQVVWPTGWIVMAQGCRFSIIGTACIVLVRKKP